MKKYMVILILVLSGCGLFLRAPTFDHVPQSDRYVDESVIYCRYFDMYHDKYCEALILFPSGDAIGNTRLFSLAIDDYFSTHDDIYKEKELRAQWGKYWISGDSLYYDYAFYLNMGGALWYPRLARKTKAISDTLSVIPQYRHSRNLPRFFKANDTLTYVRVDYPDIHNIDPDRAWINKQ